MIFWLLCATIFAYFFYTRIWVVYQKVSYYKKQGVPFHSGIYPILGSYLNLMQFTKGPTPKDGSGTSLVDFIKETYFKEKKAKVPPIVGMVFGSSVVLIVNRPEPGEELFLTKNKYFDKHPRSAKFFSRLTGDSILFAKSDLVWQQKRKSLSAALYKDKLRVMIEMMKDVSLDVLRSKWMKAEGRQIDIVKESSNLFIKITLKCLFGGDNQDIMIIQRKNGVETQCLLGETMISQLEQNLGRRLQLHLILFPELAPFYISRFDREIAFNQDQVRNLIREMIQKRREAIQKDPKDGDKGDLLSIMLKDPLFENNDEQIVNESLTFFLAGTLTQANTISNVISYLIQNPDIEKRTRESLAKNFTCFADPSQSMEMLAEELSIDSLDLNKDEYLKNVIYETMRMETPVPISSSYTVTEDTEIAGIMVKANESMLSNIYCLHHLEDQWGEDHDQFKPERFEGRGKHNPMSFMPFLAGKRVCVGKTFAENSIKVILPLILKAFPKMEFVNQSFYQKKPHNNVAMPKRPEILIKLQF